MNIKLKNYLLIIAGLALCGCSSEKEISEPINSEPVEEELVRAYIDIEDLDSEAIDVTGDFALSFLKKSVTSDENIVVSPASLSSMLAMLVNACNDDARDEIISVISDADEAMTVERLNNCWAVQTRRLQEISPVGTVVFANSLWLKEGLKLNSEYAKLLWGYFEANVFGDFNFASSDAKRIINEWVSERTAGMIPSLINDDISEMEVMLINTLCFNMPWSMPFEAENNEYDKFYNSDGTESNVEYMYGNELFNGSLNKRTDDAELLIMRLAMFELDVIMPDEGVDAENYLSNLTFSKINDLFSYNTTTFHTLHFPKFMVETRLEDIIESLKDMGIRKVFDDSALNRIVENPGPEGLVIDRILQNNKIEVKEDGVAAASVTGMGMAGGWREPDTQPKKLYINRPFIYFVRESGSGLILFAGVINRL